MILEHDGMEDKTMCIATCIGCGCTDRQACVGDDGPCSWLAVDYAAGVGVCSYCQTQLGRWNTGDRSVVLMVAKIRKAGGDEPYYIEANDMASFAHIFAPEAGDKFTLEWLEMTEAAFEALPQFQHIRLARRWREAHDAACREREKGCSDTADQLAAEAEELKSTIAGMGYDVLDLLDDELPDSLFQPSWKEVH